MSIIRIIELTFSSKAVNKYSGADNASPFFPLLLIYEPPNLTRKIPYQYKPIH